MIAWFLRNMSRTLEFRGATMQAYLWWHPFDHISLKVVRHSPNGTVGPGAWFKIREAFRRDEAYLVNEVVSVPRLDEGGITLEQHRLGQLIFRLAHTFTPIDGGTQYDSVMHLGSDAWWFKRIANVIRRRRFPQHKQQVWLQHNVEEVGYMEHFLPELHQSYGASELAPEN